MVERHIEKLRLITPTFVLANTALLAIIGWFLIRTLDHIENTEKSLFEKSDKLEQKESKDIACLNSNLFRCCEKAVTCV